MNSWRAAPAENKSSTEQRPPSGVSLPPLLSSLVAQKHDFFDSGLHYQFCINFRRRRRLSELLSEREQDGDRGAGWSTGEDSHPDRALVPHENAAREAAAGFRSG